jgi:dolichol-phosphate mannosyltransferase
MTHLSVVVPVYNEGTLIPELLQRILLNNKKITGDFEIIIVDDGSQDNTWQLIEIEAEVESRIEGIKFSRNFGHHYAITAGLHHSRGEWVIVMDGDLQDRPEVIPELYKKAQEGFDVVFVSRQKRPEGLYYRIAQKIFYWLLRISSGIDFDSRQANFSIISRKVVESFKKFPEHARFYGSTIKWLGFKRSFINADHGTRYSGKPSYTLKKRIDLASDIVLSFSERPLKVAIYFGLLVTGIAMAATIWLVGIAINNDFKFNSWLGVFVTILFFGGTILTVLGIIGIYLGRVFNEVKSRPLYIVDRHTKR